MARESTQQLSIDPTHPEPEGIAEAASLLRSGGLVAFPTETVYGLGANALDGQALGRIFVAKKRPKSDPIIAHIADLEQLKTLAVDIPDLAWVLAKKFWPGPLTLILRRAPEVPEIIAEGRDTIAVRMPAHPVARALLRAAQVPVGAPSANTFTRPSATTAAHVLQDLDGRIDMVLDGGPSTIGLESTVVDLSQTVPEVLRPGGIPLEALQAVAPKLVFTPRYVSEAEGSQAPGQMLKHYSPRARVLLLRGDDPEQLRQALQRISLEQHHQGYKTAALVADEDRHDFDPAITVHTLGPAADMEHMGRELFAALRDLDDQGVEAIVVRDPGRSGLGTALWDRLLRAAEGQVIDV